MSFPDTQATLIIRLARGGSQSDWQQFLADYWGPLVRFAARSGQLPLDEAEDVAAETFVVLVRSTLLARWQSQPFGRLRGLLCGVVRNILSNRQRVEQVRKRLLHQVADAGGVPNILEVLESPEPTARDLDTFYQAWVDELLRRIMHSLLEEFQAEGRGDYFRALYGRVCEGLSAAEIGAALGLTPAQVDNQVRVAKARLSRILTEEMRRHVERYSNSDSLPDDFQKEWQSLHCHLEQFGGLEEAIRQEAASLDRLPSDAQRSNSFLAASAELKQTAAKQGERKSGDKRCNSLPIAVPRQRFKFRNRGRDCTATKCALRAFPPKQPRKTTRAPSCCGPWTSQSGCCSWKGSPTGTQNS